MAIASSWNVDLAALGDGHAIVDWPDFAVSRLSPAGDPRALTGFSTPAGLP